MLSLGLVIWMFVLLTDIRREVRELRALLDPTGGETREPALPPQPGAPGKGVRGFLG